MRTTSGRLRETLALEWKFPEAIRIPSLPRFPGESVSRSGCTCMSEEILVVLGMLVFELWAQTNGENIPPAKEFASANEIHCPSKVVRIKHFDPLPKIGRKEPRILKIA